MPVKKSVQWRQIALMMQRDNSALTLHSYVRSTLLLAILSTILILTACGSAQQRERLHVDITSFIGDEQSFRIGDELSFLISLNENAWLYMYYENSEGNVYQLIPSVLHPDNHVSAGDFIPFPSVEAAFRLEISPPFGEERVWLLATEQQLSLPSLTNNKLRELSISLTDMQSDLKKMTQENRIRHSEDELMFTTEK